MSNVPNKITGDTLTASEFNQNNDEETNLIEQSGQTLSASNVTQMREAMMRNATAGRDCVASGTANSIVLTSRAPFDVGKPTVYQAGATYSALITQANTGAVEVNINGIGVIDVTKNGYADPLVADDIQPGLYDFVVNAAFDAVELVAKKAVLGDGGGAYPWLSASTISQTGNYIVLVANENKKHLLTSGASVDSTFTLPTTGLVDGMTFSFANENIFSLYKLTINDGTDDIDYIGFDDGVASWSWDADNSQWV